jgi:hypothetical protein
MHINFVVSTRVAKDASLNYSISQGRHASSWPDVAPFSVYTKAVRGYNAVVLTNPYQDLLRNVVLAPDTKWFV